jgi:ligand-binding SRPBCC domain-containing protein
MIMSSAAISLRRIVDDPYFAPRTSDSSIHRKDLGIFFRPENLNLITPPDMNFEIIAGGEVKMYAGQIIEYRVEFLRGIRSLWLTEIAYVSDLEYFVDEQRVGPYRFWYHEHRFEKTVNGVKMTDHVTYVPPYGLLGDLVTTLWIRGKLEHIFDFRFQKINELFGRGK